MSTLRLPAKLESLTSFRSFVLGVIEGDGELEYLGPQLDLVLEEVLSNVFYYAYPAGEGDVEVECDSGDRERFRIVIRDWGVPFNPLESAPPDLSLGVSEREVGGLGIYLVKQMAGELRYERRAGANVLTLYFAKSGN